MIILRITSVMFLMTVAAADALGAPHNVQLAHSGRARLPVVLSEAASAETKLAARQLIETLGRITGATFELEVGTGERGIVLGRAEDFPQLPMEIDFHATDRLRREEYLLRSHEHGVWLIGATDLALRHAVWDFLYRLGYRQFFPGPRWEIVPQSPSLSVMVDSLERPAYHSRRIWYGFGPWDYAKEPYRDWCEKNRAVEGVALRTGHAYDGILARNRAQFAAHPEYLGLVNGERKSTKFCISNPALRELAAQDALAELAAHPGQESVSMDPSDGGGWCECEPCARLGSITDRALTLANAVAAAVSGPFPGTRVGIYAYNQHSPPPSIQAHPAVVISIATAFVKDGYAVDDLLDAWSLQAETLGIREYYSVNTWDRDLPGAARGGNLDYLRRTIPHFHQKSARYLTAESSDNWGPNGLGYYLAARMLWDVREAASTDALVADFLDKSFGPAREPMAKFYRLLDGSQRQPLCDDLVGRMYRLLDEARGLTQDSAVHARLDDVTLYTRYVELWLDYSSASGDARQAAFESLIRHAYRMRRSMMVHTLALYRDLDARDTSVTIPDEAKWNVPEPQNPWKSSAPFAPEELDTILREGIATRKLLDFTPVSFSDELVPITRLNVTSGKLGTMGIYSRGTRIYYTWVEQAPAKIHLSVTAGLIYSNQGATKVELFPIAEAEGKAVAHVEVLPTRSAQSCELSTGFSGLHRLEIVGGGAAQATWNEGLPMTVESSFDRPAGFHGRWSLYFYVPRGTETVSGFSEGVGTLRNANGVVVHTFDAKPGYFSVPVEAGHDGRLWRFEHCSGDKRLMTVPPYLARSAEELLLPVEVVERDAPR